MRKSFIAQQALQTDFMQQKLRREKRREYRTIGISYTSYSESKSESKTELKQVLYMAVRATQGVIQTAHILLGQVFCVNLW